MRCGTLFESLALLIDNIVDPNPKVVNIRK
jgi:hypothetical protein